VWHRVLAGGKFNRSMNGPSNEKSVVVYDGECAFCRGQIARIRRWDRLGLFEYLPRQTPGITDRFPALAHQDFNTGMRLILPDQTIRVGADAVHEIARRLPRWRWLAWLYRIPGLHALARAAYAWVAAHRQSLGPRCDSEGCGVGKPPK